MYTKEKEIQLPYQKPTVRLVAFGPERAVLQTSPRSRNPELDAYDEEDW
ncbi:MAG: hypothetical protein KBT00_08005 [Bacteroidales bacterium]|nr:hypothetical protein [Candidatus Cacconaster merdequi]